MSLFLRVQEMKETKHQGGPLYSVALSFLSLSLQRFISSFSFFLPFYTFFPLRPRGRNRAIREFCVHFSKERVFESLALLIMNFSLFSREKQVTSKAD